MPAFPQYGAMPGGFTPIFYGNPLTPIIYGYNPYEMDPSQLLMANSTPIMFTTLDDPSQ